MPTPLSLKGYWPVTATGKLDLYLYGASPGSGDTISICVDDATLVAKLWRPTLVSAQ